MLKFSIIVLLQLSFFISGIFSKEIISKNFPELLNSAQIQSKKKDFLTKKTQEKKLYYMINGKKGPIKEKIIYENNRLKKHMFFNFTGCTKILKYDDNIKLKNKTIWYSYPNKIKKKIIYNKGEKNSEICYYKNGNKKSEVYFFIQNTQSINKIPQYAQPKKIYKKKSSRKIYEKIFNKNGKYNKIISWDNLGRKIYEIFFNKNGYKTKTICYYQIDKEKTETRYYKNVNEKSYIVWDFSGEKKLKISYDKNGKIIFYKRYSRKKIKNK